MTQYNFKGKYYLDTEGPKKGLCQIWKWENFKASSSPFLFDNILYISTDGTFLAVNPENGNVYWEFEIAGRATIPAFKNDFLFFGGYYIDNYLYCIHRKTGKEQWKYRTGTSSGVNRTPILYDDTLFFAAGKRIHCIDVRTGKKQWTLDLKKRITFEPTLVVREHMYAFTADAPNKNNLHCVSLVERKEDWKLKVPYYVSDPIYVDEYIYFLNSNQELCIVNAENGAFSSFKVMDLKKETLNLHLIYNDGVLVVICGSYILAFENNNCIWHKGVGGDIGKPVIAKSTIYFGTMWKGIFALDLKTGNEVFNEKIGVRSKYTCAIGNKKICYAGSMNEHELIAYAEKG